jgi:thymidine phosphorylase
MELTYVLGGAMVHLGGKAATLAGGIEECRSAIWSGRAYEKFLQVVERQGGDSSFIRDPGRYPVSKFSLEVRSASSGFVTGFGTRRIGVLAVELGAGRLRVDDPVDPKAGIVLVKKIGDRVENNDLLAVIKTDRGEVAERAVRQFSSCVSIGDTPLPARECVRATVDRDGVHAWTTPRTY